MSPFVFPEPFLAFHLFNFFLSLSCFFSLFFHFWLVPFVFICLLCFSFMKINNIKIFNCKVFHQSCVCLGFLFFFHFFLSLFFLVFSYVFVQHQCFWLQKTQEKKGQMGSCNKTFFLITCVLRNVESYRFFCPFLAKFWLMFKNTIK